jgi:hypothetical protein
MANRTVSPEIPSAVPTSRELWLQPVPETDSDFLGDTSRSDQFDLRAIWPTIFRNRWWVFAIMAAAIGLGIASIMLTQPTYRANSSILIDQKTVKILGTEDADPYFSGSDREVSCFARYIATWRGRATARARRGLAMSVRRIL